MEDKNICQICKDQAESSEVGIRCQGTSCQKFYHSVCVKIPMKAILSVRQCIGKLLWLCPKCSAEKDLAKNETSEVSVPSGPTTTKANLKSKERVTNRTKLSLGQGSGRLYNTRNAATKSSLTPDCGNNLELPVGAPASTHHNSERNLLNDENESLNSFQVYNLAFGNYESEDNGIGQNFFSDNFKTVKATIRRSVESAPRTKIPDGASTPIASRSCRSLRLRTPTLEPNPQPSSSKEQQKNSNEIATNPETKSLPTAEEKLENDQVVSKINQVGPKRRKPVSKNLTGKRVSNQKEPEDLDSESSEDNQKARRENIIRLCKLISTPSYNSSQQPVSEVKKVTLEKLGKTPRIGRATKSNSTCFNEGLSQGTRPSPTKDALRCETSATKDDPTSDQNDSKRRDSLRLRTQSSSDVNDFSRSKELRTRELKILGKTPRIRRASKSNSTCFNEELSQGTRPSPTKDALRCETSATKDDPTSDQNDSKRRVSLRLRTQVEPPDPKSSSDVNDFSRSKELRTREVKILITRLPQSVSGGTRVKELEKNEIPKSLASDGAANSVNAAIKDKKIDHATSEGNNAKPDATSQAPPGQLTESQIILSASETEGPSDNIESTDSESDDHKGQPPAVSDQPLVEDKEAKSSHPSASGTSDPDPSKSKEKDDLETDHPKDSVLHCLTTSSSDSDSSKSSLLSKSSSSEMRSYRSLSSDSSSIVFKDVTDFSDNAKSDKENLKSPGSSSSFKSVQSTCTSFPVTSQGTMENETTDKITGQVQTTKELENSDLRPQPTEEICQEAQQEIPDQRPENSIEKEKSGSSSARIGSPAFKNKKMKRRKKDFKMLESRRRIRSSRSTISDSSDDSDGIQTNEMGSPSLRLKLRKSSTSSEDCQNKKKVEKPGSEDQVVQQEDRDGDLVVESQKEDSAGSDSRTPGLVETLPQQNEAKELSQKPSTSDSSDSEIPPTPNPGLSSFSRLNLATNESEKNEKASKLNSLQEGHEKVEEPEVDPKMLDSGDRKRSHSEDQLDEESLSAKRSTLRTSSTSSVDFQIDKTISQDPEAHEDFENQKEGSISRDSSSPSPAETLPKKELLNSDSEEEPTQKSSPTLNLVTSGPIENEKASSPKTLNENLQGVDEPEPDVNNQIEDDSDSEKGLIIVRRSRSKTVSRSSQRQVPTDTGKFRLLLKAREEQKLKNRQERSSSDQNELSNDELKKASNKKRKRMILKSDSEEGDSDQPVTPFKQKRNDETEKSDHEMDDFIVPDEKVDQSECPSFYQKKPRITRSSKKKPDVKVEMAKIVEQLSHQTKEDKKHKKLMLRRLAVEENGKIKTSKKKKNKKIAESAVLLLKGLGPKASREGLRPSELLSEWALMSTMEVTNQSGECVCGKKNLTYLNLLYNRMRPDGHNQFTVCVGPECVLLFNYKIKKQVIDNPIALFDTFNRVGVPAVLIEKHKPPRNAERRQKQRFTFSLKGECADYIRTNLDEIVTKYDFVVDIKSNDVDIRVTAGKNLTFSSELKPFGKYVIHLRTKTKPTRVKDHTESLPTLFFLTSYRLATREDFEQF